MLFEDNFKVLALFNIKIKINIMTKNIREDPKFAMR